MIIVADSSPLIALALCNGLTLLDQLFEVITVPQAVYDEVVIEGKPMTRNLGNYLDGKVRQVDLTTVVINTGGLGRGEIEAMVLYKQLDADFMLVDDKRARKVAALNHIEITGSQGVLLLAKQSGLISHVKPYLEKLRDSDIYIHERLIVRTLQLANEIE